MSSTVSPSARRWRARRDLGSTVKDMMKGSSVLVVVVDHDDDLAGDLAGLGPGVDVGQLGQRDALGALDTQLAVVDQRHEPRQLLGVAADEDADGAHAA